MNRKEDAYSQTTLLKRPYFEKIFALFNQKKVAQ
jgi:hypothetical protein